MTWTTNSSPRDNTGKTRQSGLFKHSKPTSSPSWPVLTTNSPYCSGATYSSQQPTELTLNLLCQSRVAPKILAFAHVHGTHDYLQKPFTPIGCVVQMHVKPDDRLSWDTRSEPGFNLGTSMEHHRCTRVYVTRIRATRISDTVLLPIHNKPNNLT